MKSVMVSNLAIYMYVCVHKRTHIDIYKKSILKTILFLESIILHAFSHVSWQYTTNAAWPVYSTHAPNLFLLGSFRKTSQNSQNDSCQQKKRWYQKTFPLQCGSSEMKIPFKCCLKCEIAGSLCSAVKL